MVAFLSLSKWSVGHISNFVSLFSHLLHIPDTNTDDWWWVNLSLLGNDTTAAAYKGAALQHNPAYCFTHSAEEVIKKPQGMCVLETLNPRKYPSQSLSEPSLIFSAPCTGDFAALLIWLQNWKLGYLAFRSCLPLNIRKKRMQEDHATKISFSCFDSRACKPLILYICSCTASE